LLFLRCSALFTALALLAASAFASTGSPAPVLRAYGPGGPHQALQECADLYRDLHGVSVGIIKAGPAELAKRLRTDGDIYFTGAEYMLEDFVEENPGVIDLHTVDELFQRRIGILVREGNPLGIKGIACLRRDEVDLVVADLENMESFLAPVCGDKPSLGPKQIYTGADGVNAWCSSPEIDAWVTYKSWHLELEEYSDFIEIPCDHALRSTMVAITSRSENRKAAQHFIDFLKSPEARRIFVEHGWE
jgi:accessory colonization factor AcfC